MRPTTPSVYLISSPSVDWNEVGRYLQTVGGEDWALRAQDSGSSAAELLIEFAGRLCYRSWAPGLNPNVSKVRSNRGEYLTNILASGHGSVLEHANFTFVFKDVSRVFTHELVRHRAGTAVSQESLRYVRLTEIPFQHPEVVLADPALLQRAESLLAEMESFQLQIAAAAGIDEPGAAFSRKKEITSAARRYAPDGVSTSMCWTANVRALRHVVAMRTASAAEAEIRHVFGLVATILKRELPNLFGDFEEQADGSWVPTYPRV